MTLFVWMCPPVRPPTRPPPARPMALTRKAGAKDASVTTAMTASACAAPPDTDCAKMDSPVLASLARATTMPITAHSGGGEEQQQGQG